MSLLTYDCGSVENTVTAILDTSTGSMLISGTGDIDNYADGSAPWYSDQENITQVTINKGVTRIGTGSFYGCESLSYISIPNTVTSFGANVFKECTALKTIKIPKTVTNIGNYIFADSGIESVKFYGNPPNVGTDIFDNVTATCYIPEGNEEWDSLAKATVAGNGSTITWTEFDPKPSLLEYDELDYFWSKIKHYVDNSSSGGSSLPIIDDKTFIKYLAKVISDSNHTNTSTTLYVSNPEYFSVNACFYVKKDSTHFFYGIVSAVNNNTGALTYSIPASDGGTFFSPDDGQLIVNYGNPMNGGVYLDWANDRVDLYQNHTELERYYNIYDPIFNINAWNSTTAGIAEEDGVVDVSGNDNHGQAFGGVTVVKDKVMGRCFSFDGVDDYLSFPSMVNMFQNLDGCTFTFKIKINALPSSSANVFGGIVGETNILSCRVNSGGSIYITASGGDKSIAANQLLTINDVFSVCFVFDYSNSLARVYINGSLSNQAEWYSSSPTEVLDCFGIGAKVQTSSSAFWLNGEISDFRFFDKALTSEQIKVIHNQSLVTQYLNSNIYNPILNLDADYSTTASIAVADGVIDVSGNHNNGQAFGGVTVLDDGDGFGFAIANNPYMELPNSCDFSAGFSVAFRFKPTTANVYRVLVEARGIVSSSKNFLIMTSNEMTSITCSMYPNGTAQYTSTTTNIELNKEIYYVVTYYNEKLSVYVNADLEQEVTFDETPLFENVNSILIGKYRTADGAIGGELRDFRIYPRALTASEVYNIYQQSLDLEALENPEKLLSYNEINVHHFDNNSLVQDNMFRLGNLNGVPGISDNRPGVFIGGENEYIRYDKLNGLRIKGTAEKAETAQLAKQLGTTTIGSSITPIYLVNGNPTECELEAGGGRNLISGTSMNEVSFTGTTKDYNLTSFAIDSIQGNDYIVISFEAKASISRWIDFYWVDSASASHAAASFSISPAFNLTTEYKRYYGIFKCMEMNYTPSKLRIRQSSSEHGGAASGATIYIKKLKVEFGKAPSTWTPAPEDTVPSATKATQDGSGNTITSTYATIAKTYDDTTNTSYRGMRGLDGSTSGWVRTTTRGIIPVQSGAAGSGHSGLGTSSWYFATAYVDNIYGKLNGNADTATTATNTNNAKLTHTVGNTEYPLVFGSSFVITDAQQALRIGTPTATAANCALRCKAYCAAANTQGESLIVIGNNIAKTAANNSRGGLTMYGTGAYYLHFRSGDVTANRTVNLLGGSADVTLTLPSSNGTLALTSSDITGNAATATTASACSGNAASATYATNIRLATNTASSWYYPLYATGATASTNYQPKANAGFRIQNVNNTTTSNGYCLLQLGTATAYGTSGNAYGAIYLYKCSDASHTTPKRVIIKPPMAAASSDADITVTLPSSTGTIALKSDLPTSPTSVSYTKTVNTAFTAVNKNYWWNVKIGSNLLIQGGCIQAPTSGGDYTLPKAFASADYIISVLGMTGAQTVYITGQTTTNVKFVYANYGGYVNTAPLYVIMIGFV